LAYYGSILSALVIYVLVALVAIGHMPVASLQQAQSFALSAAAERFLGAPGFALLSLGAVLASASAISSDLTGASQLPAALAQHGEAPGVFMRTVRGQPLVSIVTMSIAAILAVDLLDLHAISTATSAGFLLVFAAVNAANTRLASATGSLAWVSAFATAACLLALVVMVGQIVVEGHTRSAIAVVAIALLALLLEIAYRTLRTRGHASA
jgi:amino acid transporter